MQQSILLIDDDEDDRELFVQAVKEISETAMCTAFSDAATALRALTAGTIFPDIIFLDLNMPVMNGQQFLNAIKANGDLQQIPVVIFSTSSHPATIQLMIEMGAHDFITKPTNYGHLTTVLTPFVY